MKPTPWFKIVFAILLFVLLILLATSCSAQELNQHRFYDKPGKILLGTAVGLAGADVGQSCYWMARGGEEAKSWANPWPAKTCGRLSLNLFGQVALQEGVAYLFHRTQHHKLERLTRFFSISQNTYGIIYTKRQYSR